MQLRDGGSPLYAGIWVMADVREAGRFTKRGVTRRRTPSHLRSGRHRWLWCWSYRAVSSSLWRETGRVRSVQQAEHPRLVPARRMSVINKARVE